MQKNGVSILLVLNTVLLFIIKNILEHLYVFAFVQRLENMSVRCGDAAKYS